MNPDNFSVKWTGQVKAPVSGSYTFSVTADDGVRLFLNGAKVIEGWKDQSAATYTHTPRHLAAGTLYNIELHYYEHGGDAVARLHWSYPGQPDQADPAECTPDDRRLDPGGVDWCHGRQRFQHSDGLSAEFHRYVDQL